ncbi:MAG: sarcosine oxidase subunit delta [Kordiimonadaceae bacterium]|jgi:methylglutamate dehydrogenase subunit B|nr:sarcosine oxidase subunit delta [Kordiimonadaceae bacterium]MBT6031613.1 sarcosine oxidase subunit delta [Kordiimonadaceae bacterium]
MIIKCPHCGPREASEYTYIGDATTKRPDHNDTDMDKWNDYVFLRENPRGAHAEHWQHTSGCRSFVKVLRDTVTHEISGVSLEGPWQVEDKS